MRPPPKGRTDKGRSSAVPKSVLEAIRMGLWDFEPPEVRSCDYDGTDAMPGTREKLEVFAERIQAGLPLWHPLDRHDAEAPPLATRPRADLQLR